MRRQVDTAKAELSRVYQDWDADKDAKVGKRIANAFEHLAITGEQWGIWRRGPTGADWHCISVPWSGTREEALQLIEDGFSDDHKASYEARRLPPDRDYRYQGR